MAGLSNHIKAKHNDPTPGQRQADAMLSVLMSRRLYGGGYDDDSSDDDDDDGGMMGFSGDEVHELMCQGVKPWDDDAWDVMAALYDPY